MIRTFNYSFVPASDCPIKSATAELTVDEIEDAGIREVLQTPGASWGSWTFLDALLEPTGSGSPFIFKEPLGQAREVKVALSGLFGRFVARAYLERYFKLSIFAHLGSRTVDLDGRLRVEIDRRARGDLPDWLACDGKLSKLYIAEAKGCHDQDGGTKALVRAWAQARRIDVMIGRRKAGVKRLAIVTRWAASKGGASLPLLAVRDPEEQGEFNHDEMDAALVGVTRLHVSNLLRPLGYSELSDAVRQLATTRSESTRTRARASAERALNLARVSELPETESSSVSGTLDALLGDWVTRAGPAGGTILSAADRATLERLHLRPVFVGLERRLVEAVIAGHPEPIRKLTTRERRTDDEIRTDGAGWCGRDEAIAMHRAKFAIVFVRPVPQPRIASGLRGLGWHRGGHRPLELFQDALLLAGRPRIVVLRREHEVFNALDNQFRYLVSESVVLGLARGLKGRPDRLFLFGRT